MPEKRKHADLPRQYAALTRAEADLEKATNQYEIADDYFKSFVPPILHKLAEFMPFLLEIAAQIQFTLLQHCYSDYHHYAETYGYPEAQEEDVIVAEWEGAFLGLQHEVETGLKCIAQGKARHVPMNTLGKDTGVMAKLPSVSVPSFGRGGKKPPPPPPPSSGGGEDHDRFSINRKKSNQSLSTARSIRSRNSSKTLHEDYQRDDSPPPPLPGPRPNTGYSNGSSSYSRDRSRERDTEDHRPPSSYRSTASSYGGGSTVGYGPGTGYVAPTPLAGLRPSALKGASTTSLPSYSDSRIPTTSAGVSMRNGAPSINIQDSRAPGVQANVPIKSVISAARSYNGSNNQNTNSGLEIPTLRTTGRRTSDSDFSRSTSESSYISGTKSPSSTGTIRSPSFSSATSNSGVSSSLASAAAAKKKPPPPPPKKKHLGVKETWVRAIYDFEGQAPGDLSFSEGERIKVTKKTESVDDWWEGEVGGNKGAFPANYVELE